MPAPAAPANRSGGGSGALVAFVGVLGLGAIAAVGAVGYVLSTKKAAATPASAPPSGTPLSGVPLLAETAPTPSASANANARNAARPAKTPEHGTVSGATASTHGFATPPLPSSAFTKPAPSTTLGLTGNAQRCTATMTVSSFRPSSPTCSFNEKVRQGPGRLDFPCDGGAASATFGAQVFSGNVSSTTLSLTQSEPFDFNGCSVISTQRIFGARTSNQATYSYSERIVGGSCSGVSTCRATATVEIR